MSHPTNPDRFVLLTSSALWSVPSYWSLAKSSPCNLTCDNTYSDTPMLICNVFNYQCCQLTYMIALLGFVRYAINDECHLYQSTTFSAHTWRTSMVHMSKPIILATIMNSRVLTTTLAVSATQTCYATCFHVTHVTYTAATMNQEQNGTYTKYTGCNTWSNSVYFSQINGKLFLKQHKSHNNFNISKVFTTLYLKKWLILQYLYLLLVSIGMKCGWFTKFKKSSKIFPRVLQFLDQKVKGQCH